MTSVSPRHPRACPEGPFVRRKDGWTRIANPTASTAFAATMDPRDEPEDDGVWEIVG